jgi:hypothetical protein
MNIFEEQQQYYTINSAKTSTNVKKMSASDGQRDEKSEQTYENFLLCF